MPRSLAIPAADGTIDAQVFTPASASGPLPAVVMFTDIGGVRPSYYEKAQTVANAGYAVLLPNVYYRSVKGEAVPEGKSFRDPDVRAAATGYAKLLTPAALAGDFTALVGAIDEAPEFAAGGIAAIGYCMTGSFVIRMAAQHPDRVVAAAGFHSARLAVADDPDSPVAVVGSIKGRVYFGHADKDQLLPPDQIARMDHALADAGVHFATEYYKGAAHGFTAKDAPIYHPEADALHFKRVFTLLEETLR
jgi:carboxymethylenebutenolidase